MLRSPDLGHFLGYTVLGHADRLKPLIDRMVASVIGEVAKAGAGWAAVAWSYRGIAGRRRESVRRGQPVAEDGCRRGDRDCRREGTRA